MYNVLVSQCYFVHWPIVSVSSRVSVIVLSCHSTKNLNLLGGCCKGIDSPDTCGGVLLQQRIWVHMNSPSKLQGVKTNCTKGLGMISLYYNHGFWKHVTHICNLLSSKDLDLILLISHVENLWGVITEQLLTTVHLNFVVTLTVLCVSFWVDISYLLRVKSILVKTSELDLKLKKIKKKKGYLIRTT